MKTEHPRECQKVEAPRYKAAGQGSIPDGVIGIFHWHNPSGRAGVASACNSNEYQEYFVGVKAAGA